MGSKVRTLAIAVANSALFAIFKRLPFATADVAASLPSVASASVGKVDAAAAAHLRTAAAAALAFGLGLYSASAAGLEVCESVHVSPYWHSPFC